MWDRILFPTDGSDAVRSAFEYALAIAEDVDAELIVLNVADTSKISYTRVQGEVIDAHVDQGDSIVEETVRGVSTGDVRVRTDVVQGVPDESIVAYAAENDVDMILMPTHGREGFNQQLLGSVTERVLRRASMPVLTVSPAADPGSQHPIEDVLVPVDDSEPARRALDQAAEVVSHYGGSLQLLHVLDEESLQRAADAGDDPETDGDAIAAAILQEAAERVPASVADSTDSQHVRADTVPDGIRQYLSEHEIDLVVMGTHGRTGIDQLIIGSATEELVRTSSVPVLVVSA